MRKHQNTIWSDLTGPSLTNICVRRLHFLEDSEGGYSPRDTEDLDPEDCQLRGLRIWVWRLTTIPPSHPQSKLLSDLIFLLIKTAILLARPPSAPPSMLQCIL